MQVYPRSLPKTLSVFHLHPVPHLTLAPSPPPPSLTLTRASQGSTQLCVFILCIRLPTTYSYIQISPCGTESLWKKPLPDLSLQVADSRLPGDLLMVCSKTTANNREQLYPVGQWLRPGNVSVFGSPGEARSVHHTRPVLTLPQVHCWQNSSGPHL